MERTSDLLRDALHLLTEADFAPAERAGALRAEAYHRLTEALRDLAYIEQALDRLCHAEARHETDG